MFTKGRDKPFQVLCSMIWPLNRNEAGRNLVLLPTFLFSTCKSWSQACQQGNNTIYTWKKGKTLRENESKSTIRFSVVIAKGQNLNNSTIVLWLAHIYVIFCFTLLSISVWHSTLQSSQKLEFYRSFRRIIRLLIT